MRDDRPFEERLNDLQEGLKKLCLTYRVEILPALHSSPSSITANIVFIDLNNKAIMEKYGIAEVDDKVVNAEVIEPPSNPLRN